MATGAYEVLSTDIDTLTWPTGPRCAPLVDAFRPDIVLHGGACTAVDACESDPDTAFAVNALGTRHVAEAAAAVGAHLVYISTDYVFDGTLDRPYVEWDQPNPRSVYGRSKLGGELEVRGGGGPSATVVRTAWVSGAHGANMVKTVLRLAEADPDGPLRFVDDQHGCPTFTADLARAVVRLALDRRPGHLPRHQPGRDHLVRLRPGHPGRGRPRSRTGWSPSPPPTSIRPGPAPRPANSRLDNAALRLSGPPPAARRGRDARWTDWSGCPGAGPLRRHDPSGGTRPAAVALQDGRE